MKLGKKSDRADRMKAVEREFQVAGMALDQLEKSLVPNPDLLTANKLSHSDLKNFRTKLHDTYFIRLFAEFETGLKDYWKNGLEKPPETRIMDVINSVAARCGVPDDFTTKVQAARKYRNHLVHQEDSDAEGVGMSEARRYFGRFFGRLPDDW